VEKKIQTAVAGATGYAGFELARLLLKHGRLAPPVLFTREDAEKAEPLDSVYPHIAGNGGHPLVPFSWDIVAEKKIDVLFLATPHEKSFELVPEAAKRRLKVIDLSGAWRLQDDANRAVYKLPNLNGSAGLLKQSVYGLPELHKEDVAKAQIVANPGCYATSVILGLAPLAKANVLDASAGVVCDCKSGVSGAGKEPTKKTHFVEVADNLSAYSVFGHRHTGEILEQLGLKAGDVVFTTHLLPIPRGILSTMYVKLKNESDAASVEKLYRDFYKGSHFVRVFAAGELPQIQYSVRTNYCDIGFALAPDKKRLIVVSCLDNLMKGAAGQAVQNMNVMLGFPEWEGLN